MVPLVGARVLAEWTIVLLPLVLLHSSVATSSVAMVPLVGARVLTEWTIVLLPLVGANILADWTIDHGDHSHTDVHKDTDFVKRKCNEGAECVPVSYSSPACSAWTNGQATREVKSIFYALQCGYLHDEPMVCVPSEHVSRVPLCNVEDDKRSTSNYNMTTKKAISTLASALSGKGTPWNTTSPPRCGVVHNNVKITGGTKSFPGEWPWMAALIYKRLNRPSSELTSLCGGSLVSRRAVLTAAHCVAKDDKYELVAVRLAENDFAKMFDCKDPETECHCSTGCDYRTGVKCLRGGSCAPPYHEYKVDKVVAHPGFRKFGKLLINDLALVFLDKDVMLTDHIQPACLPYEQVPEDRVLARIVTGWGNTNGKVGPSTSATILQKLKVTLVPIEECGKLWFENTTQFSSEMICARSEGKAIGASACTGDSGGPLVYTTEGISWVQYGLVSFGSPTCGDSRPTFYAALNQDIVQWITGQVGEENMPSNP